MRQFLQGKAAPIHHRSHEYRKRLFHTGHLTSRPLQNYLPQPQRRDCWERNQLIAAPCCYRVLGSVRFSEYKVVKRTVDEMFVSGVTVSIPYQPSGRDQCLHPLGLSLLIAVTFHLG